MCTEQCIEWHTRTHTQPPLPMAPPCQWPPHPEGRIMVPPFNGPPFGNEESWSPIGFFVEKSHVLAYFVAAKCCELEIQDYFKREVYHGRKCLYSLFEQHGILHVAWAQGLLNPGELTCLLPIPQLPRDAND